MDESFFDILKKNKQSNLSDTNKKDSDSLSEDSPWDLKKQKILENLRGKSLIIDSSDKEEEKKDFDKEFKETDIKDKEKRYTGILPKGVARAAQSAVSGLTDLADFGALIAKSGNAAAQFTANKLVEFFGGKGRDIDFELPRTTENFKAWVKDKYGDLGDETIIDDVLNIAGSLGIPGIARKLGTKAIQKFSLEGAQKVAEKAPKALKKAGEFFFPKYESPTKLIKETAIGTGALKGAEKASEEIGEALKDKDIGDTTKLISQIAGTLAGGIFGGGATAAGIEGGKSSIKNYLANILDPEKIAKRREHNLPIELGQVLKTDHPLTSSLKSWIQHAADEPFFSGKTDELRSEIVKKIQGSLVPEKHRRDEHLAGEIIQKAYESERGKHSKKFEELLKEAEILKEKPKEISFTPFKDLSTSEQLNRINEINANADFVKGLKDIPKSNEPETMDLIYKKLLEYKPKTTDKLTPSKLLDQEDLIEEVGKLNKAFPELSDTLKDKTIEEKYKIWDKYRAKLKGVPEDKFEESFETTFKWMNPYKTKSLLDSLDTTDFNKFSSDTRSLIKDYNSLKDEASPTRFYSLVKEIGKTQRDLSKKESTPLKEKKFLSNFVSSITDDFENSLSELGKERGKSYKSAREFYSKLKEEFPTERVNRILDKEINLNKHKGIFDSTYQDLLNGEVKITPYIMDSLSKDDAKNVLAHFVSAMGGKKHAKYLNSREVLKKLDNANDRTLTTIQDLSKKAYGKEINIKTMSEILDDIGSLTKNKNVSGTGRANYIYGIQKDATEEMANILKGVAQKGEKFSLKDLGKIPMQIGYFIFKKLPTTSLLGIDSKNADQLFIKGLEEIQSSKTMNGMKSKILDLGKHGILDKDAARAIIRGINSAVEDKEKE